MIASFLGVKKKQKLPPKEGGGGQDLSELIDMFASPETKQKLMEPPKGSNV